MQFLQTKVGKRFITMVILLSLVGYFVFHAMQGKHGLRSRVGLKKNLVTLEKELTMLRKERRKYEHYIQLMHDKKIDPDMLDEKARKLLNLAHPEDIIIMLPNSSR